MDLIRARFQTSNLAVFGLDLYNGTAAQLSLFQATTSVSFPLLQMAANGTFYGAWRDEIMLIDQTGTQRLVLDVRGSVNWEEQLANELQYLTSVPVPRVVSPLASAEVRVGEQESQTVRVANTGQSELSLSGFASDINGVSVDLPSQTIAAGDTADVVITYIASQAGSVSGTVHIDAPGALTETIVLPFEADVLPGLKPRISDLVESVDLGNLDIDRAGSYSVMIKNEGEPALVVSVSPASSPLRGSETTIPPGESAALPYSLDLSVEGLFTGSLILTTNDPEAATVTISVTATGISVPAVPTSDLDGSGTVDFPDFLIFAAAFGTSDPTSDINGNGTVDFADFLIFAKSFGKPIQQ